MLSECFRGCRAVKKRKVYMVRNCGRWWGRESGRGRSEGWKGREKLAEWDHFTAQGKGP